ncbi:MAG: hypothetical protein J0I84_15395 [Terrimonas sp.]|nr:hypothetical protein [Terrimonas sp.]OJY93328.1 MAG: hypothetical protein BGP13_17015 [Sphingobacteriales bacterium 40-81]
MKKMLSAIICIFLSFSCFAQFTPLSGGGDTTFTLPAYADVNSNYRTYANNVFGLLEASRVPTGLLLDYAFDFTEPKIFNGVTLHDSLPSTNANAFTI